MKTIYFSPILEKFLKGKRIKTLFLKRIQYQALSEDDSIKTIKDAREEVAKRVETINKAGKSSFHQGFLFSKTPETLGGRWDYWIDLGKEYKVFFDKESKKQEEGGNDVS